MKKVISSQKFLSLLAVVAIMAAGSCSSDDDVVADAVDTSARPLIFHVSETPLADDDAPAATRTAPTTTSTLSGFNYCYLITGGSLSDPESASNNESGTWSASGWPSVDNDETTVNFYAYANASSSANVYKDGSKVVLNFEVDGTTYSQKDLLVATQSDTYTHSNGNIGFQFSHACGAVRFSLSKTNSLSAYSVLVKSVKIHIPCSGTYCFDDGTWVIQSDSEYNKLFTLKSYENGYLTVTSEKQFLSNEGDYLFLLPQTLTPWDKTGKPANAYVEIECKISNGTTYKVGSASNWGTAYLPLGITIEKGKIYPVNISLGTALRDAQGDKIF